MNAPRIEKTVRRIGLRVAGLARFFRPPDADRIFAQNLMRGAMWQNRLERLTDKQMAVVVGHHESFGFHFGTIEDCIVTEIVTRLERSEGGPNPCEITEAERGSLSREGS